MYLEAGTMLTVSPIFKLSAVTLKLQLFPFYTFSVSEFCLLVFVASSCPFILLLCAQSFQSSL